MATWFSFARGTAWVPESRSWRSSCRPARQLSRLRMTGTSTRRFRRWTIEKRRGSWAIRVQAVSPRPRRTAIPRKRATVRRSSRRKSSEVRFRHWQQSAGAFGHHHGAHCGYRRPAAEPRCGARSRRQRSARRSRRGPASVERRRCARTDDARLVRCVSHVDVGRSLDIPKARRVADDGRGRR